MDLLCSNEAVDLDFCHSSASVYAEGRLTKGAHNSKIMCIPKFCGCSSSFLLTCSLVFVTWVLTNQQSKDRLI